MDASRFDALTRSWFSALSRRRALAAFGGALATFGLADGEEAFAAKSGRCKPRCGECQRCDEGKCRRKNGKKRCKRGRCTPRPNGTACSSGLCRGGVCDPNACIVDVCLGGSPVSCGPGGCLCVGPANGEQGICGTIVDFCSAGPCAPGQECIDNCMGVGVCIIPCGSSQ